jgi:hypothetical protein
MPANACERAMELGQTKLRWRLILCKTIRSVGHNLGAAQRETITLL